jgi:hypothetical protein
MELSEREHMIAERLLKEIRARLGFLMDVGLDYLSLGRAAGTLAGGEAQADPPGDADRQRAWSASSTSWTSRRSGSSARQPATDRHVAATPRPRATR